MPSYEIGYTLGETQLHQKIFADLLVSLGTERDSFVGHGLHFGLESDLIKGLKKLFLCQIFHVIFPSPDGQRHAKRLPEQHDPGDRPFELADRIAEHAEAAKPVTGEQNNNFEIRSLKS